MTWGPAEVVLFSGLVIATFTDLRTGKIPNALTFPMMALGLAFHLSEGQLAFAGKGIGVAFAVHYGLWALGVERGGDAKLFMAMGALRGWSEAIETTLWSAVVYLPVGIGVLVAQGKLRNLVAAVKWTTGGRSRGEPKPEPTMLRTAPIIAVAWLVAAMTSVLAPVP